jgi:hypothetical protein
MIHDDLVLFVRGPAVARRSSSARGTTLAELKIADVTNGHRDARQ